MNNQTNQLEIRIIPQDFENCPNTYFGIKNMNFCSTHSFFVKFSNFCNFFIGKLTFRMEGSSKNRSRWVSFFTYSISDVFFLCSKEKMFRIKTYFVVTFMKYQNRLRSVSISFMPKIKLSRKAMDRFRLFIKRDNSISVRSYCPCPLPTTSFSNFFTKIEFFFGRKSNRTLFYHFNIISHYE